MKFLQEMFVNLVSNELLSAKGGQIYYHYQAFYNKAFVNKLF